MTTATEDVIVPTTPRTALANLANSMSVTPFDAAPAAIRRSIEEGYINGFPYQWAIELWRNAQQAVDRALRSGEDMSHGPILRFDMLNMHGGALKRVVWNTGPHMTFDELRRYMPVFGNGSGDDWSLDNPLGDRHAGARETTLPAHPAGVVVGSYHPTEMPDGAMVWLMRDAVTGLYGPAKLADGIDQFGNAQFSKIVPLIQDEYGLDWMQVMKSCVVGSGGVKGSLAKHGGVFFALLGEDLTHDDVDGVDQSTVATRLGRAESATTLANVLLDKLGTPNQLTTSLVYRVGNGESANLPRKDSQGKTVNYDSRTVHGLDGWLSKGLPGGQKRQALTYAQGAVPLTVNGIQVGTAHWWLLDKQEGRSFAPNKGLGYVAARYRNEIMPGPKAGDSLQQLSPWGVTHPTVAVRTRIIVELAQTGPGWHIIQNPARSEIRSASGGPIPWDDFRDQFNNAMPTHATAIYDAILAARSAAPRNEEAEQRVMAKLRARLQAQKPQQEDEEMVINGEGTDASPDGEVTVKTGGQRGGGGDSTDPTEGVNDGEVLSKRRRAVDDPNGVHGFAVRRRPQGLPEPEWVDAIQWMEPNTKGGYGYDPTRLCVVVNETDRVIVRYNKGHEVYTKQVSWFTNWVSDHKSRNIRRLGAGEVVESVQQEYHLDTAARLMHNLSMDSTGTKDALDKADDGSGPCILTMGARGFHNVDQSIMTDLGQRASGTP